MTGASATASMEGEGAFSPTETVAPTAGLSVMKHDVTADALWRALVDVTGKPGREAFRLVMVSPADVRAALAKLGR